MSVWISHTTRQVLIRVFRSLKYTIRRKVAASNSLKATPISTTAQPEVKYVTVNRRISTLVLRVIEVWRHEPTSPRTVLPTGPTVRRLRGPSIFLRPHTLHPSPDTPSPYCYFWRAAILNPQSDETYPNMVGFDHYDSVVSFPARPLRTWLPPVRPRKVGSGKETYDSGSGQPMIIMWCRTWAF